MSLDVIIKKYDPQYREAVRTLFRATAFMGLPLEKGFCDPDVYTDIETKYYTDKEPQSCFVAVNGEKLVGYLIGCKDDQRYALLHPLASLLPALKGMYRYITGKYDDKTRALIQWYFREGHEQIPRTPPNAAHFHINLDTTHRTKGIGSHLVHSFEKELSEHNIPTCFVQSLYSGRLGAVPFFRKIGYQDYDMKKFTGLKTFITDDVYLHTLVKEIKQ